VIVTKADFANLSLIAPAGALRRRLQGATVVLSDAAPADLVTMNSQVTLRDEATGEPRLVSVVYPADADRAAGRLSVLEAAGTALLGAVSGQVIELELGGGAQRVRVQEVVYQPERSLRTHMVVRGGSGRASQ
jgi:regulator of nucleoside diphosphate kinase